MDTRRLGDQGKKKKTRNQPTGLTSANLRWWLKKDNGVNGETGGGTEKRIVKGNAKQVKRGKTRMGRTNKGGLKS